MTGNIIFREAGSRVRIRRPLTTTNGFVSDVDETIAAHLDELNTVLGRQIFDPDGIVAAAILGADLTPKRATAPLWAHDSLIEAFRSIDPSKDTLTLGEYIDRVADLSALKYGLADVLANEWSTLDYNTQTVLSDSHPAIRDYLVAVAVSVMGLGEVNGLKNFILSSPRGAASIADYATVSAARTIIHNRALIVPDKNDDAGPLAKRIRAEKLSLSINSFESSLIAIIDDQIFSTSELLLIEGSRIHPVPEEMKPQLVKYIKAHDRQFPLMPINAGNVDFFLPLFMSQIEGSGAIVDTAPTSLDQSDKDFDVKFFEDDRSMIQVSKSAVKCAAQLYYGMVGGDELDVFGVVQYFTHKYLIRGGIEILDGRLRDDLQTYVFSNRFPDLKTGKLLDRTRPAERHMFYRQVFAAGAGGHKEHSHAASTHDMSDEVIVNHDFPRFWKVLMLESAQYLERAQLSPNPDSFVSRQKVMQAVEDLQYNLSTNCTGMANVITPLIYAELNFVIRRIFMHPEVLRNLAPTGSAWWRVVERLCMEMKHSRPKSTVLYNKAKLGHDIIASIADYNPSTFENDASFSAFISNVDAFITTQSILQAALTHDLKHDHDHDHDEDRERREHEHRPPAPEVSAAPAASNGKAPGGEWDF
jgi:hypothetical protein